MIDRVEGRFCPTCGAYWRCDCEPDVSALAYLPVQGCEHDWVETVGVDLDEALGVDSSSSQVMTCRLCGIYAVEART